MMENIFSDIAGRCVTVNTEKSTFPLPPAFLWSLLFVADKGNRTTQMFSLTYISSRRFFFFFSQTLGAKGKKIKTAVESKCCGTWAYWRKPKTSSEFTPITSLTRPLPHTTERQHHLETLKTNARTIQTTTCPGHTDLLVSQAEWN